MKGEGAEGEGEDEVKGEGGTEVKIGIRVKGGLLMERRWR